MPMSACIEPATKHRVAEWDMGKEPDEVTEGEWIAWFKLAYDVDPRALETLKKRIAAAVVFDMSITDADSRIGRMLDNMSTALRRDRQEWILREEGAAVVKIITDAIKPASLHRAVTEQMALSRNKPLKKDMYRFVMWLREYAIGQERYVGYEDEKPASKPVVRFESAKSTRSRSGDHPITRSASPPTQRTTFVPSVPAQGSKMGCLKFKSPDHMVRDCPDVTKDEAVALLKGHANALVAERARGAARSGVKRIARGANESRDGLQCLVEGVLPVTASLLDSGADLSLAPGGLVSTLIASGVPVELLNTAPVNLQPYGASSEPISVAKQVLLRKLEHHSYRGRHGRGTYGMVQNVWCGEDMCLRLRIAFQERDRGHLASYVRRTPSPCDTSLSVGERDSGGCQPPDRASNEGFMQRNASASNRSALNQPSDRLGGEAPVRSFTGLPGTPPVSGIARLDLGETRSIDWVKAETKKHIEDLSIALEKMHKEVKAIADRNSAKARASRKNQ
ncbi:hypothetical protein AC1031_011304 [Aphanomyces cochlioides]|nr:hypothetical protein AC1031_011304 [Aphanomyces cochlioides]